MRTVAPDDAALGAGNVDCGTTGVRCFICPAHCLKHNAAQPVRLGLVESLLWAYDQVLGLRQDLRSSCRVAPNMQRLSAAEPQEGYMLQPTGCAISD